MDFPDFPSVERHLNSLINYEQVLPLGPARTALKLEPSLHAAARLGLPLRLKRCVHVAGTKGKGSTVAFLEALLSPGMRTLSFTSPHLIEVKERVKYCGEPLSDDLWQTGFAEIVTAIAQEPPIRLSYFESVFIFFLWAAERLRAGAHLVEVGLGGRWDATNILMETAALITTIDYDHTEILGETLTAIASDKAGIVKPHRPLVIGRQPEEAREAILAAATMQQAEPVIEFGVEFGWSEQGDTAFRYADSSLTVEHLRLSVPGVHQRDNAAAAIRAARLVNPGLTAQQIRERIGSCTIPGRQQLLKGKPDVLVDVAHNPVSFRALAETIRSSFAGRRVLTVIGMMKDKDARSSLAALASLVPEILCVELNSPRTQSAEALADIARSLGIRARCLNSREEAFTMLHAGGEHDLALIAGSFYLAGDYLLWRRRAGIA